MNSHKMLISLIPWIVFTVIVRRAGADFVGWASALAGLLTLGIAVKSMRDLNVDGSRGSLKVIDVAGVVTFAVLTALALTGSPSLRQHLVDYGRGACALILAVVMLGSLLVVPFTEQYARESVPRAYWRSPIFRTINSHVSAAFGVAVLVTSAGHIYAGYLESRGGTNTAANLILNWVIPVLVLLAAIAYARRVSTATAKHPAVVNPTA